MDDTERKEHIDFIRTQGIQYGPVRVINGDFLYGVGKQYYGELTDEELLALSKAVRDWLEKV